MIDGLWWFKSKSSAMASQQQAECMIAEDCGFGIVANMPTADINY